MPYPFRQLISTIRLLRSVVNSYLHGRQSLIKKSYSMSKINRRLKRFLKKTPHSEASVIITLKSFPVWCEEGIMRDIAVETLILLWKQYEKDLVSVKPPFVKGVGGFKKYIPNRMGLAYRKAITTYVQRVREARDGKRKWEEAANRLSDEEE